MITQTGDNNMTWENIIKVDFSFRDVVKNSRGIYSKIFEKLRLMRDYNRLAEKGAIVLADAMKSLEDVDGLSVANKRKIAEGFIQEPMLLVLDMFKDPKNEEKIKGFKENIFASTDIEDNSSEDVEEIPKEVKQAILEFAHNSAKEVVDEFKTKIDNMLFDKEMELTSEQKYEVTQEVIEVVKSKPFIDYNVLAISALVSHLMDEQQKLGDLTEPDIDFDPRGFGEQFQEVNKMDWENILRS